MVTTQANGEQTGIAPFLAAGFVTRTEEPETLACPSGGLQSSMMGTLRSPISLTLAGTQ